MLNSFIHVSGASTMIRIFRLVAIGVGIASVSADAQSGPPISTAVRIEGTHVTNMRTSDVSEFEPAIAAVDSGGRCVDSQRLGLTDDQKSYLYSFGPDGKPTRNVMVVVDSLNQLVRYSDLRGQLSRSNADMLAGIQPGVITSISLNAVQGLGMLQNRGEGQSNTPIQVKGAALLDAPNLGVPRLMIEHVLRECAGISR